MNRRMLVLVFLAVLACGLGAQALPNGYYSLAACHNGKVLDVGCDDAYDASRPNSARDNVCVYPWHGNGNQIWHIEYLGNGFYRLTATHNGKVLDVGCDDAYDASRPNSARDNVCVYPWHGNGNQQWKIEPLGNGEYRLVAKHNGKVLDVGCDDAYDASRPNSARDNVCVYPWHGNGNQRWRIVRQR